MTEHSRWSVVALGLLASGEPVEQIFTMSTPFGGSQITSVLLVAVWHTPVLADIHPFENTVRGLFKTDINIPVRSVVVSTGGHNPLVVEANDGIITVASQDQTTTSLPPLTSRCCWLLADPVIDLARDFLFAGQPVTAGFQFERAKQTASQF
jgi:hypothetical protein